MGRFRRADHLHAEEDDIAGALTSGTGRYGFTPSETLDSVIIKGKIGALDAPKQLWIYIGNDKRDTIPVKQGQFEYRKETLLPARSAMMVRYKPYTTGNFFEDHDLITLHVEQGEMYIHSQTDSISTALGYTHRLEDFRGKTVVMDFWFTGCKGCVQVARMLREQVKPVFAGDTSVVFVAVSLDIDFLQWKRSIRGGLYTSEGQLNLFTNGMGGSHPIYKHYGFSGAPQLLVIDPEGYVVSSEVTLNGNRLVEMIKKCISAYTS